ncbi:MAG: hypothetical protein IT458_09975 [Planctomycetes bacterium]|nr:hypothetical protein [Planctomycetota bacterium]
MTPDDPKSNDSFLNAAKDHKGGLVSEFVAFMRDNKKWWLIPFLVVFGLLGLLLILSATGAAPFIYAMF